MTPQVSQVSSGADRSASAADVSPLPAQGEVVLLNEAQQRPMYLFPRVPFHPNYLNGLQSTYLDEVIDWGWYVLGDDGLYAPTDTFLAQFHATHAQRVAAALRDQESV